MSIRVISKQQFSDGTTIDGNRIEQALQQLEQMCDTVPRGAVRTRFTRSQLVLGWNPIIDFDATAAGGYTHEHPWIVDLNTDGPKYRLKGYKHGDTDVYYIWQTSFTSDFPLIIHALDLFLAQDAGTAGVYKMASGSAPPYVPPNVSDIGVHITIDAPFIPEDRTQNDIELHRRDFETDSCLIRPEPFGGSASAGRMRPDYPGGALSGWSISSSDLNIPITPMARVRFAIVIPKYTGGTGLANWGLYPWRNFVPSLTLTTLEPNRHG